jgi:hypothetical protein
LFHLSSSKPEIPSSDGRASFDNDTGLICAEIITTGYLTIPPLLAGIADHESDYTGSSVALITLSFLRELFPESD